MDPYSLKPTIIGILIGLIITCIFLGIEYFSRGTRIRRLVLEQYKVWSTKGCVIIFGRLCLAIMNHILSVLSLIIIFFMHFALMISILGIIMSGSMNIKEEDVANVSLEQMVMGMIILFILGVLNLVINYVSMKVYLKALKAYGYSIFMLVSVLDAQRYRKYRDKYFRCMIL